MAGNQEEAFKEAAKGSDDKKTNRAYNQYVASMEKHGQTPKSREDLLG
jgi:hypothetical protein